MIFANGRYMANDVIKVNILFPWLQDFMFSFLNFYFDGLCAQCRN